MRSVTFREGLDRAATWADDYLRRVGELPVAARVAPGEIRARLPEAPPEQPEPFEALLRDLDDVIVPGLTHWNHPRFFAWFANTGSEPGVLAELLIAALNVNNMTWLASPAATELELTVMDWLAQLFGLPREWHGHIEDTASTATVAALAAARTRRPGGVVYASEQANFSNEKAARLVGLEYRKVPVDDAFRMTTDFPLDDATAVIATVGTTGTTSVDPVPALADRCEAAGVWLHIDAAYAGSAAVCPELRWCMDGVDRADSVVVNPHKWLFTPMDCSTLWTRRPEAFHEAFALVPEYLAATPEAVDIKDYGPALGRRFRALKLWFVLRWYGAEGLRALIAGAGFLDRWSGSTAKYNGPIRVALEEAGVAAEHLDDVCALRKEYLRKALAPRPGAVDTLRQLRADGFKVGLITVCSEDIETLWPESDFAGLFDAEVF